jgi:uncharacterized protein YxjI
MRLVVNQKYFALRDRFTVNYDNGQPAYAVEGKLISIGKKFTMYYPNGKELFFVRQRLFRLLARFDIEQNGNKVGVFRSQLSLFTKRGKFTSDFFGDIKIKGNVMGWTFRFYDGNGNQIAETSKKILKVRDTYTVDIMDMRYQDIIAALVVIIDALYHRKH